MFRVLIIDTQLSATKWRLRSFVRLRNIRLCKFCKMVLWKGLHGATSVRNLSRWWRSGVCLPQIMPEIAKMCRVCFRWHWAQRQKQYLCQQQYPREVAKVSTFEKRSERPQTNICWSNGSKKMGWLCDYSYCIFLLEKFKLISVHNTPNIPPF